VGEMGTQKLTYTILLERLISKAEDRMEGRDLEEGGRVGEMGTQRSIYTILLERLINKTEDRMKGRN
jgi:hypothetical protein